MNEVSKQQLSALLDGDLGDQEARFLMRRIESEPELAELWSRYLLIGDSLRKATCLPASSTFVARVMQQIGREPTATPHRATRWLRYGLGGSIAASVTIAALVWMQPPTRQQVPAQAGIGQTQISAPAVADMSAPTAIARNNENVPDLSALMLQSRGAQLQVQPASAVIRQQPADMRVLSRNLSQPLWLRHSMNSPRQTSVAVDPIDFSAIVARRHAEPPRMPAARN